MKVRKNGIKDKSKCFYLEKLKMVVINKMFKLMNRANLRRPAVHFEMQIQYGSDSGD